ncbi:hypothetical protein OL383_004420 [Salmonella enterica]|nr:hypothetical protein [Salmonella enterica]
MGRAKYYRELHELREQEKKAIKQAFKQDYQGYGFRDRFLISRECLRALKEDSKIFII